MKFGTWCSKWQAVRRNLLRFWPACLIFGVVLILHVMTIRYSVQGYPSFFYMDLSTAGAYGAAYGYFCAILLFRDLFTQRYAVAVHALPQTREAIFLGNLLSGLALVLIPLVPGFLLMLSKTNGNWGQSLSLVAAVLLLWLYGFAIGTLGANLSGTAFGAVCTGLFLAFGIPFGESFADLILTELLPGISSVDAVPVTVDCSPLLALVEWDYDKGLPWGFLSIWGVVSVLLLGCALWLYKKRKLEAAGEFAAFSGLKPILKAMFTFFGGIILGVILCALVDDGVLMEEYDLWNTLGWLLPGNLLAVLIGEMLVEKTVRVFKGRQLLRYGLCALLTLGVCALIWADPARISTKVPEQEDISSVHISDGTYGFTAESPEAISAVRQLHEMVTDDLYLCVKYPTGDDLEFYYTLKNGSVMVREYTLEFYDYQSGTKHPYYDAMQDYFNDPRWVLSCYLGWELPEEALTGGEYALSYTTKATVVRHTDDFKYGLHPTLLKQLLYHLGRDIEAGKATLYNRQGTNSKYRINFESTLPDGKKCYSTVYVKDLTSETYQYLNEIMDLP